MRRKLLLIAPLVTLCALLAFRPPVPPATCDPDNGGLILPKGFCATLFATVPNVRNLAVAPNGDVFAGGQRNTRGITIMRDRKGTGHADTIVTVGAGYGPGSGIALDSNAVYFSPDDKVVRFAWKRGALAPSDTGTVIVSGMPTGGHGWKTIALGKDGGIFVDHGSSSNSCQVADRNPKSPGRMPCPDLEARAGIWRYETKGVNQTPTVEKRWVTGFRNGEAIAVDPATGVLWGATHGRDDLRGGLGYSDSDNAEKPAEEFGMLTKGADYGWPYCYYDPLTKKKVQAPEYGGDGTKQGDCATKTQPAIAFPGHWAPMQIAFMPGKNSFGAEYASGAFLAFHGSWNRAPLPQAGFRVVFMPFKDGKAVGTYTTFTDATAAGIKISGVAMSPDGTALYVGSDGAGKVWRVVPTTSR